jgi:hypothetical protein
MCLAMCGKCLSLSGEVMEGIFAFLCDLMRMLQIWSEAACHRRQPVLPFWQMPGCRTSIKLCVLSAHGVFHGVLK